MPRHQPPPPPKPLPDYNRLRLRLLKTLILTRCRNNGCARTWCQRTKRCQELGRLDRLFPGGEQAAGRCWEVHVGGAKD